MAAKKKATARKATKKTPAKASVSRLTRLELPPTLKAYQQQVQKRLAMLEKEIEKAQHEARRQAARLLRNASRELGRIEAGGEQGWRKLAGDAQKQALRLLSQLEKAIAPSGAVKKAARKTSKVARKAVKESTGLVQSGTTAVKDAAARAAAAVSAPPNH